jgi:hypothetical protein
LLIAGRETAPHIGPTEIRHTPQPTREFRGRRSLAEVAMRAMLPAFLLVGLASTGVAQQPRPYTEGPVVVFSYIRTKPGMFDKYMEYLDGNYKRLLEAQKKAGLVTDYAVYTSMPATEQDWDVLLMTTYKNMAALDNLDDRMEAVTASTLNQNREQSNQAFGSRSTMRDPVGGRLLRQLILK